MVHPTIVLLVIAAMLFVPDAFWVGLGVLVMFAWLLMRKGDRDAADDAAAKRRWNRRRGPNQRRWD